MKSNTEINHVDFEKGRFVFPLVAVQEGFCIHICSEKWTRSFEWNFMLLKYQIMIFVVRIGALRSSIFLLGNAIHAIV